MLDQNFILVAAAINVAAGIGYALDTFRGRNQPNRITWVLWAAATLGAAAVQLTSGAIGPAVVTFSMSVGPLLVLAASFVNRQAYWHISKLDWVCGALSALALVLWLVTRVGLVALVLSILTDALASLPTVIKAYRYPQTETSWPYMAVTLSSALTLLTIQHWSFTGASFALWVMINDGVIAVLVLFPHTMRPRVTR